MNLDERMTEETKQYVKANGQNSINVFQIPDINQVRGILNKLKEDENKKVDLSHLNIKEYFVPSIKDNYQIPVTAYMPKHVTSKTPIVLFCHGGGWQVFGRITHHLQIAYMTTQSSCIWISIEYRLAPEFKYPTQIDDCCSVLKWVSDNKTKLFGSDPSARVGICGESAGGQVACCVVFRLKELLSFQIQIYPVLSFSFDSNSYKLFSDSQYLLPLELMNACKANYFANKEDEKEASPILNKNFNGLPNCLLISAELDPMIDDAYEYKKKLELANVECEHHVLKGTVHAFFQAYMDYKNAFIETGDYIVKFLKSL